MEFDIDTSQFFHLKNNDNNKNSLIKLDNSFINNINNPNLENYENLKIKIRQLLMKKDKNIISIIGEIKENNQTIYTLSKNEYIYIYLQDKEIIQKIKENIIKNDLYITISINKIILYPIKLKNYNINLIIFIQTIVELYLLIFDKYKINKNDTILIKGNSKDEENLFKIFLSFIGYNTIYLFHEITDNLLSLKFDKILDFTNSMLETENKILTFNLLNQNGIYNSIIYELIDNENIQLIPNDFTQLFNKNITLNFNNLNSKIINFMNNGKLINVISDIIEKINIELINEKLKEIKIEYFTNIEENKNYNEIYLSLFNLI